MADFVVRFIEAGVPTDGIPGLGTPDRLYAQLVADLPASSLQSLIGFSRSPGGGFDLVVKPYACTPAVDTPDPGSGGSLGSNRGGA